MGESKDDSCSYAQDAHVIFTSGLDFYTQRKAC